MNPGAVSAGRARRLVWLIAAVCLCGLAVAGMATARTAQDPVEAALRQADAYASPVFYPRSVSEQIHADAVELAHRGEKVKLAAVPFVAGRNLAAYAENLRAKLGYAGTLVVTTPNGDVAAAGPRTPLSIETALTAIGASEVVDPAARLLIAGEVSTPPPTDSGSGVRDLVVLVGLALLGGALAIGWGLRREQRRAHARTMEARGLLKVYADALGSRGRMLAAAPSADAESRGLIEAVAAYHVAADALVDHATTERELADGASSLRYGFGDAERAGALVGIELPQREPFADLCSVDPSHGAIVHPGEHGALCPACTERIRAGQELVPRRVVFGGVPVSFLDAPVPYEITTPPEVPVG
jgi:hypothetical protein